MIDVQFRPLAIWPYPNTAHRRTGSAFKATWELTLKLIDRELRLLGAKQVIIEAQVAPHEIRIDGWLRQDARPRHPGVILNFTGKTGSLRYPCDQYMIWRHNVRAIALALEALRAVDRYGVTKKGEQYRGWEALPGPAPTDQNGYNMSMIDAATFMWGTDIPSNPDMEALREQYRRRAFDLHPDRNRGNDVLFKRLQEAKRVLEQLLQTAS